jgi:7,8-dihydro-6-hydroxymethylpterin dimethyltransferase
MRLSDYTFLGTTQSLCPTCLKLVNAKIISRRGRVYFRKRCDDCGTREDFVCSDVNYFDRMEAMTPSKIPPKRGVEPKHGCPYDCGICTEHEQHTCIALVEITSNCNLTCPLCFASSAPGGKHLSLEACKKSIDRIVELEGRSEVVQLSGGEPTLHPQFLQILEYALTKPIDYVQINTNGIRLANDQALVDAIAVHRERVEIYLQFDGLDPVTTQQLRGEAILDLKLKAIERLGIAGLNITLAVTLQGGVSEKEYGPLIRFAKQREWITGISFQPATYSGRYVLPAELEQRITFPDVIKGIASQADGTFQERDFVPLPCAHPNCHFISISIRDDNEFYPLTQFLQPDRYSDLLANGISFSQRNSQALLAQVVAKFGCCPSGGCAPASDAIANRSVNEAVPATANGSGAKDETPMAIPTPLAPTLVQLSQKPESALGSMLPPEVLAHPAAARFFGKWMSNSLTARDLFRITITSFLDVYNFDLRQLMKCCTHHVLPSGHVIPFCAYNVLYREGHVALPDLIDQLTEPTVARSALARQSASAKSSEEDPESTTDATFLNAADAHSVEA